jgi:hypothetical protein
MQAKVIFETTASIVHQGIKVLLEINMVTTCKNIPFTIAFE